MPTIGTAIDWMAQRFGSYPFPEFGYVTVKGLGTSLETQTMVVLDENSLNESTMVHELAHMWFGDWVSLNSWRDVWRIFEQDYAQLALAIDVFAPLIYGVKSGRPRWGLQIFGGASVFADAAVA